MRRRTAQRPRQDNCRHPVCGLLTVVLCLVLAQGPALAAPYDGPRAAHAVSGQEFALFPIPGQFTVTRSPGVTASWNPNSGEPGAPAKLEAGPYVLAHDRPLGPPRYRTDAYRLERLDSARPEAGAVARALMALPGIVVAGPLYRRSHRPEAPWRAMTSQLLVQLQSDEDIPRLERLAANLGVHSIAPRGLAPHQFRLVVPPGAPVDPVEAAMALQEASFTRWAQVDWLEPRAARFLPDDELFSDQWHLDNTGQANGIPGNDVNGPEAWDRTLGSSDVIIAVLDSGIDEEHADLAEDLVPGYDFIDGDADPSTNDSHGTKVAGTAAAPAQGVGVVGACPGCRIMPIRMLGTSHEGEAEAHDFAVANGAWVINNSWGPMDGTGTPTAIPPVVATAIDYATTSGRDGRGVAIFWAAGNGHPIDTCSDDGYVAYPSTIAIGGSTNEGEHGDGYSELCPELDLSAPSSGGTIGLTTTTTSGDGYTSSFGGTSGAAPVAAGVGGLALSAFPELTWDGLRTLLHETAWKIDPGDAFYDEDGHSNTYGYGRIDAGAALETEPSVLSVNPLLANCSTSLSAALLLPNKAGLGTIPIYASSEVEPGPEGFLLEEDEPGDYRGTIQLSEEEPSDDDGLLAVVHGDVVSITSIEVEDGVTIEVDCEPPQVLEPTVEVIGPHDALIQWETDEASDGWVIWTDDDGNDYGNTTDAIGLRHDVWANALQPCTSYTASIGATDAVSNVSEYEDLLDWVTPGDPNELPEDAPEDADPCDPTTWNDGGEVGGGGGGGVMRGTSDYRLGSANACACSASQPIGLRDGGRLVALLVLLLSVGTLRRRRCQP